MDYIHHLTDGLLGTFDIPCPVCGPGRQAAVNRKRGVLRIWREKHNFASFYCIRCGLSGSARDAHFKHFGVEQPSPVFDLDYLAVKVDPNINRAKRQSEKARHLIAAGV